MSSGWASFVKWVKDPNYKAREEIEALNTAASVLASELTAAQIERITTLEKVAEAHSEYAVQADLACGRAQARAEKAEALVKKLELRLAEVETVVKEWEHAADETQAELGRRTADLDLANHGDAVDIYAQQQRLHDLRRYAATVRSVLKDRT